MKAILKTDGGSRGNPGEGAAGALLFNTNNELLNFNGEYLANTTNNNAEYQALVIGLKMALKAGVTELACYLDSELIVKQLNGEYKIKDENIKKIKLKIDTLLPGFKIITFTHIPREENRLADRLVNLILDEHQR
ncbi:MAG TPA: ribonuclease HI family protein [Candidatus Dojkabacteria bacterium]|nr:ribonuclease HI family protein [Candidatus Dojkabacteria bacterium]